MATILEIANEAANILGHSGITQTEYDNASNKLAKGLSQRYESARDWVLGSYPWKDALKTEKIDADTIAEAAADTKYSITLSGASSYTGDTFRLFEKTPGVYYEAPAVKWIRQYTPDSSLLRLRLVTDLHGNLVSTDFQRGLILSDEATIYAAYIYNLPEADIPYEISSVIAHYLAWKMARYMGQQEDIADLRDEYLSCWRFARSWDAQQDSSRVFKSTEFLQEMVYGNSSGTAQRFSQMQ
jgi:hypothetical protein